MTYVPYVLHTVYTITTHYIGLIYVYVSLCDQQYGFISTEVNIVSHVVDHIACNKNIFSYPDEGGNPSKNFENSKSLELFQVIK